MASTFLSRPTIRDAFERCFDGGANPVVVYGPPGCGKSAMVRQWAEDHDQPVYAVGLADTTDLDGLIDRISAVAGPIDVVDTTSVRHLLRSLGAAVVVLDDCDRIVDLTANMLAEWRDAAPLLRWVVTSRERVAVDGAEFVEVGPMNREQAVRLFEARARAVRPGFELSEELVPVVEELVDELDRIPLAVELAAARVNTLGPAEILRRLPERFRILRGRATTLQQAIALSWDLLDEWERLVLGQCVVFRGGFTVDAAEGVVQLDDDGPWSVDVLEGLVQKSLLRSTSPADLVGEVRFEMLASIREFVARQAPPSDALRRRHAQWTLDNCLPWTHQMRRRGGADARRRLELDQANLLAAFESATEPEMVVSLALVLDKLFRLHGAYAAWERVLDRALEVASAGNLARRTLVLRAFGELHMLRGQFDEAASMLELAASEAGEVGELVTLAWTRFLAGELERRRGNTAGAQEHLREAADLAHAHGMPHLERMAHGHRAGCLVDVGDLDGARTAIGAMERLAPSDDLRDEANLLKRVAYAQYYLGNYEEQERLTRDALELARQGGDNRLEALCIQGLGDAAFARFDFDQARTAYVEALALHRAHGSVQLEGALLGNLGNLHHRTDQLEEARRWYRQALALHASTGAKPYEAVVWFGLGVLELEQGHLEDADAALGRAAELNAEIGNISDVGSCTLVRAWVKKSMQRDAAPLLEQARSAFTSAGDDDWVALVDFVATGKQPPPSEGVVGLCARALSGEPTDAPHLLHVRAALASVGRDATAVTSTPELRIAADASWFEAAERVDLRRRRAPRRILRRLVEMRQQTPGAAIDVYETFDVGWPDEVATPEAAADRVYWAIRTLRKLGLEAFLATNDEGYLLDPDARISVE